MSDEVFCASPTSCVDILLMTLLEQLDIRLVTLYIRNELNPVDFFSRLTDRDACTLSPSVQRMIMQ